MRRLVLNDRELLLEAFKPKVELIEALLLSNGHKPVLFETLRTPARAQYLKRKGTSRSKRLSMHCYGAAADFICADHAWGCAKRGCTFFDTLGTVAHEVGVWWGGDMFRRFVDKPHVQAVPYRLQNRFRASDDFEAFVRRVLSA